MSEELENTKKRFWSKVDIPDLFSCWEWSGAINSKGYGSFRNGNNIITSSRQAYSLIHGNLPEKLCVLHKCDNRKCVNPAHLFLGTKKDNTKDMDNKGRRNCGKGNAKLTKEDVICIRILYQTQITCNQLAKMYNVYRETIGDIVKQRTWKNV